MKIFVTATEFVAATSRTNSVRFDFLRLVAATKFCCGDKDFNKNSSVHTKQFVAATCRLTLLLQLVARPVHMEWSVAPTCCSNLSPSVYRPSSLRHKPFFRANIMQVKFNLLRRRIKSTRNLRPSHKPGWLGWPGYRDEFRLGFIREMSVRFPRWEKAKDSGDEFCRHIRETKQTWRNTKILTFGLNNA